MFLFFHFVIKLILKFHINRWIIHHHILYGIVCYFAFFSIKFQGNNFWRFLSLRCLWYFKYGFIFQLIIMLYYYYCHHSFILLYYFRFSCRFFKMIGIKWRIFWVSFHLFQSKYLILLSPVLPCLFRSYYLHFHLWLWNHLEFGTKLALLFYGFHNLRILLFLYL